MCEIQEDEKRVSPHLGSQEDQDDRISREGDIKKEMEEVSGGMA